MTPTTTERNRIVSTPFSWIFPANIPEPKGVYDGDTFRVDLDLGLRRYQRGVKIRLARVNCPELRGRTNRRGRYVRDHVRSLLVDKPILIRFELPDPIAYGRFLAEVWFKRDEDDWKNLSDYLLAEGLAELYTGATH